MTGTWIVAYDISNDRDRERVAAQLLARGVRLQRSVFQVVTDDPTALLDELTQLIRVDVDVIQAFRQCGSCAADELGVGQVAASMREPWWIA